MAMTHLAITTEVAAIAMGRVHICLLSPSKYKTQYCIWHKYTNMASAVGHQALYERRNSYRYLSNIYTFPSFLLIFQRMNYFNSNVTDCIFHVSLGRKFCHSSECASLRQFRIQYIAPGSCRENVEITASPTTSGERITGGSEFLTQCCEPRVQSVM